MFILTYRNYTCNIKYQAGKQIDGGSQYRNAIGCAGTEMLGYDIHAHEGKPRNQDAAVQCDPFELQQRFIGQQVHADYAYHKKRNHRHRDASQQKKRFLSFAAHP